MPAEKPKHLKDALVDQALSIIEEKGAEHLSLRDVARRLGVSHQAPYKHFTSRDHILAAVVERCFVNFARHLEARPGSEDPFTDLHQMGLAYLDFAQTYPLQYRLMFNTALPDGTAHPGMLAKAQYAFSILRDRLSKMALSDARHPVPDPAKHDALFIWSALHGLASLMQSDVTITIGLDGTERAMAVERLMRRLGLAIGCGPTRQFDILGPPFPDPGRS